MTVLKRSLKRFGYTTLATIVLAVIGFQTAFGTTNGSTDPRPEPGKPAQPQSACAAGCVSASGWVRPVDGPVWGGFRNPSNPAHQGVDLGAPKGTTIRAASAGTVVRVRCNVTPETFGCNQDGNAGIGGCGWYIDLAHTDNIYTRYCHLLQRPDLTVGQAVTAGQTIALTGDSGNSGAPHLHFEVHIGSQDYGAIDPVTFMAEHGAPLGTN